MSDPIGFKSHHIGPLANKGIGASDTPPEYRFVEKENERDQDLWGKTKKKKKKKPEKKNSEKDKGKILEEG
jgi:hypothetical protein